MQTILAFILVFGLIVFFHEFGHFIFAKRAGILVREFAIGMGPKLFGMKKGKRYIRSDYCLWAAMSGWPVRISIKLSCNLVIG